jgi:RNA polymerase sigma-70 factor (ECF subfamily)
MTAVAETDEGLLRRYVLGDCHAFAALYRRHELRVWRYLERNVGNRASAEELMQEVWFAVARDAARYEPSARFTTWLFTIARNRMIDSLRTMRRLSSLDSLGYEAAAVLPQLTTEPGAGPLAAVLVCEEAAAVTRAIGQLPSEQRDAVLLQLEGELTLEEIAAVTGSTIETTKSRLRYARSKLRELLREYA